MSPGAFRVDGRTAVVTGGTRGLGRAIADTLSGAGARIMVIDLASALATADLPGNWQCAAIDTGAPDSLAAQRAVADAMAENMGGVDIVVANAGLVPPWRGVADLDASEWQRVMDVNVWGVAATLGAFAPVLAHSAHASMIVMASLNGHRAHPKQVLYTASKHAVIGVMRAAALDLGAQGTRVNALAPGPIATQALRTRVATRHQQGGPDPETALAALGSETALGSIATPAQVANAALWLASDLSAGITGIVVPVDAGLG